MKSTLHKPASRRALGRRTAVAIAIAVGFGTAGAVYAQSTTGRIFGQAPVATGETVQVTSASGLTRVVAVDSAGRYNIGSLPLGNYTVTLMRDGQTIDSRSNVTMVVGAGTEVSFANPAAASGDTKNLSAVTVRADSLPAIDVSSTVSHTVITAAQLERLPLSRSAEAIAQLAPGVAGGSSLFGGNYVSIGGSSVTENAYYINGFNTTDPVSGFGGITLPYGSLDQEEILTAGYGAAYGRSDGGVLSQVGKRGTNEWHFGAQVLWSPKALSSDGDNTYYGSANNNKLYRHPGNSGQDQTTYDAYVSGPLIKDKLFLFASAEGVKTNRTTIGPVTTGKTTNTDFQDPKWYTKLDWNINDSNIFELTAASNTDSQDSNIYNYDKNTYATTDFVAPGTHFKTNHTLYVGKFTSYITDDITLTALFGKMNGTYYSNTPGIDTTTPYLFGTDQQNPAYTGGTPILNSQTVSNINDPRHTSLNENTRIDLAWRLGDHTVTAGMDNQTVRDNKDGTTVDGLLGYSWEYDQHDPNTPIAGAPGTSSFVDATSNYANGASGYYVDKYIQYAEASVRVKEHAQYLQDAWQVNDRLLLDIGVRNDSFTNYNGDSVPYIRLTKPQLAPRLGFSWDVMGDSSFKVYGNAGRYYLALPASVAQRSAGSSVFTREYFTYSGIDANGVPQNLTPIQTATGGPISANNEYGQPRDPKTAAASNISSEYQDTYLLGFDKKLGSNWVYGVKAQVSKLKTAIDDTGDKDTILAKAVAMGIDPATIADNLQGSYLINPNKTADFVVASTNGGYVTIPVSPKEFGFPPLKRNYYSLEMFLEHPFDGKWFGRIDYVYSRSYGNTEGQVRSDIGQSDVSATEDWDFGPLMTYANGYQSNDHPHALKIYGSYQVAPEWMLSGNLLVQSGTPKSCLGFFGGDINNPQDPAGYGSSYHFCDGKIERPGDAGRNPFTKLLALSVEYRPEWAAKKLALDLDVFNVFNQQVKTQSYPQYGSTGALNPSYGRPFGASPNYGYTAPRTMRLGIRYDY